MDPEHAVALLESSPDFILGILPDGTIESANRVAVQWAGVPMVGTHLLKFILPRYYRAVLRTFQRALEGGETVPHEIEIMDEEGHSTWMEAHLSSQANGVVAVLRNTSRRHGQVERVRLLAQTLMSVQEAVALTDVEGHLTFVNPAFVTTFGYTPAEAQSLSFRDMVSGHNSPEVQGAVLQGTQEGRWEGELLMQRKSGHDFPAHVTTSLVRDERGRVVAAVGVCRDTTQQKLDSARIATMNAELQVMNARLERQNEELQALNQFRANMISLVAHDLRSPLSSIQGYTSMLLGGQIPPEKSRHTLNRIVDLVGNTAALVGGLLEVRKVEDGLHQLELSPMDAREVAERAIRSTVHEDSPHVVEIDGVFPEVRAHENLLYQILVNLVSNAVKYSPSGGRITVRGTPRADDLLIEVQDTGIGIPEGLLQTVFEAYERGDRPAIQQIQGHGLGLNLVRAFVELQGGQVWAESVEGEGS
ncbi:MAG TPA: PAS domain S-box protein, partial [Candidatus Xenobia bacterium]